VTWAEKEVPSLELCKRLKELGYPQEGEGKFWEGFWWTVTLSQNWHISYGLDAEWAKENEGNYIKAPTCRELNEWLLKAKGSYNIYKWDDYELEYCKDEWQTIQGIGGTFEKLIPSTKQSIEADTLPNTYAKMLIWLVENGYLKFEEVDDGSQN